MFVQYEAVQNGVKVQGMIYDEEKVSEKDYILSVEKNLKETALIPISSLSAKAQEVMNSFSEDMFFFEEEEWTEEDAMAVFNELVKAGVADPLTECGEGYHATLYGSYQCKINYVA